jgi:ABC-type multidrug transport system ATPase subunit
VGEAVWGLDEPTSGLDPATAAGLLRRLRGLAQAGSTVLFTTHAVRDLAQCDRTVFLARGGRLAFVGSPPEAHRHFGVERLEEIYERLADDGTAADWVRRFDAHRETGAARDGREAFTGRAPERRASAGFGRQWSVLTRRTLETLARNRR